MEQQWHKTVPLDVCSMDADVMFSLTGNARCLLLSTTKTLNHKRYATPYKMRSETWMLTTALHAFHTHMLTHEICLAHLGDIWGLEQLSLS